MVFQKLVVANRRQMLPSLCGLPVVGPNGKSLKRPRDDCLLTLLGKSESILNKIKPNQIAKWSYIVSRVSRERGSITFRRRFDLDITAPFYADCPFLSSFEIVFKLVEPVKVHVKFFYNNNTKSFNEIGPWPLFSGQGGPFANSAPFQGVVNEIDDHKRKMTEWFSNKKNALDVQEFVNPLSIFVTATSFHELLVAAKATLEKMPVSTKKPSGEAQ